MGGSPLRPNALRVEVRGPRRGLDAPCMANVLLTHSGGCPVAGAGARRPASRPAPSLLLVLLVLTVIAWACATAQLAGARVAPAPDAREHVERISRGVAPAAVRTAA